MIIATGSVTVLLVARIYMVLVTPESTEYIHNPMVEETLDMRDGNI